MRYVLTSLAVALGLLVGACGETKLERGLSGAAIGAGAGAAGSAVTGGSPVTGGLLGGAAGGAAGVFTDPDDVNLGDPIWDRDKDDED